jgi:hypothetical protein
VIDTAVDGAAVIEQAITIDDNAANNARATDGRQSDIAFPVAGVRLVRANGAGRSAGAAEILCAVSRSGCSILEA